VADVENQQAPKPIGVSEHLSNIDQRTPRGATRRSIPFLQLSRPVFVIRAEDSKALRDPDVLYTIHMRRTNLVLDGDLLEEATRVLGVKTYSAAVNKALEEIIRIRKIERIPELLGKVRWEGSLSEMRGDRPMKRRRGRR
jgi:Arc/MetJ family transcription regulator